MLEDRKLNPPDEANTSSEVVILPCQQAPKQLTARFGARSLQDHFLAFLNANNTSGFQISEVRNLSEQEIGGILMTAAERVAITEEDFKKLAKVIKKISRGILPHMRALEIVSALFGYSNWHEAHKILKREKCLSNRRSADNINAKIYT